MDPAVHHCRYLPVPFGWGRIPWSADKIRGHVRKAVSRGLPTITHCEPHDRVLKIVGGGPSLKETYPKDGFIVAVNGSHDWLIEQGVIPAFCVLMDASPVLARSVTPHPMVTYLVASMCHPKVFRRLEDARVLIWHASQGDMVPIRDLIPEDHDLLGGGSTAALRMIVVGYFMGFRKFELYALDSSFRMIDGKEHHHAYDWHPYESEDRIVVQGYPTTLGLYIQICDFWRWMDFFEEHGDPVTVSVHGDGLLQHTWRQHVGPEPYTAGNQSLPGRADAGESGGQLSEGPSSTGAQAAA